jgi:hypothetical protein
MKEHSAYSTFRHRCVNLEIRLPMWMPQTSDLLRLQFEVLLLLLMLEIQEPTVRATAGATTILHSLLSLPAHRTSCLLVLLNLSTLPRSKTQVHHTASSTARVLEEGKKL